MLGRSHNSNLVIPRDLEHAEFLPESFSFFPDLHIHVVIGVKHAIALQMMGCDCKGVTYQATVEFCRQVLAISDVEQHVYLFFVCEWEPIFVCYVDGRPPFQECTLLPGTVCGPQGLDISVILQRLLESPSGTHLSGQEVSDAVYAEGSERPFTVFLCLIGHGDVPGHIFIAH